MMFGLNPKSLHEIEEVLAQPNCTVDELLKCASVTSQFRNGNKALIEFLLLEKNSMRIFEIIQDESNRAIQKSLLGLFQTGNPALHRIFADNLVITEYAVNMLESKSNHANFSVGIMSRVVSRAFDLWPEEMGEIFRISKTIYKVLIKHIDSICVFHTVQDLITDTHKGLWLFIWQLFRFLVGYNVSFKLSRRKALIDESLKIDTTIMTENHKENILNLLRIFFKLRLIHEIEFANNTTRYIIEEPKMTIALYSLAMSLNPNEQILKRAVQNICRPDDLPQTAHDFTDPIIEKCIQYIAYCNKMAGEEIISKIFCLILLHKIDDKNSSNNVSNIVYMALKNLLAGIMTECSDRAKVLKDKIRNIVMVAFNETKVEENPIKFSFLIAFETILMGNEGIEVTTLSSLPNIENDNSEGIDLKATPASIGIENKNTLQINPNLLSNNTNSTNNSNNTNNTNIENNVNIENNTKNMNCATNTDESDGVKGSGGSASTCEEGQQWKMFKEKVVDPWNNDIDYDTEFVFDLSQVEIADKSGED